jgi:hypothetical protein
MIPKPNKDGYCFSFYYHMWGTKVGSLVVSLLKDSASSASTSIFMRNGTQANRWFRRQLKLNAADVDYGFTMAVDAYLMESFGYGEFCFIITCIFIITLI